MSRTPLSDVACSIARSLDVVGPWWTPLIIRDVYLGITRFDALQQSIGLSRKVLSERLRTMVEEGVLERTAYQHNPPRYDYSLTEKGGELAVVLMALMAWGDRWTAGEAGPPMLLRHDACGKHTDPQVACSHCGEPLRAGEVTAEGGPGARLGPGTSGIFAAFERQAS